MALLAGDLNSMRTEIAGTVMMCDESDTEQKEPILNHPFKSRVFVVACILLAMSIADPAQAQRDYEPVLDKFNLKLEASWLGMKTQVRLDSEVLGTGTTLSFEDDLALDRSKTIPTFAFEWQIARRHRLGVRWQDISREASSQALTEIQWGDEIIPIDAAINLGFDVTQYFVDYTYFPWVKERWAAGFGLGLRVMELSATISWMLEGSEEGGSGTTDAKGTGPLPYIYFEYRRLFSDHWRFMAGFGWLYVSIEDISGGQVIGRVGIEYLLGNRWGFGGSFNLSAINVEWAGVETDEGESVLTAHIDYDINDISLFVRVRF
jgi:hypothetical protein